MNRKWSQPRQGRLRLLIFSIFSGIVRITLEGNGLLFSYKSRGLWTPGKKGGKVFFQFLFRSEIDHNKMIRSPNVTGYLLDIIKLFPFFE